MLNRFCNNTYSDKYEKTTSTHIFIKTHQFLDFTYKFQFFDLAGEDKDGQITKQYANKAHGFVILGEATDPQSLEDAAIYKKTLISIVNLLMEMKYLLFS